MGERRLHPLIAAGRVATGPRPGQAAGLLLLRLGPAAVFLAHGYLKLLGGHYDRTVALFLTVGIPLPEAAAWFVGGLELAGGVALLLGLLARPAASLLAAEMAVAIYKVRIPQGFVGATEYELVILLTCVAIALLGPGRLSVESVLTRSP
ncbi:MAG: DoxX family protein [Armatimonadetes bacterium]|nr:DoxX family protein [Armatimonadota bacterium]